MTKIGNFNTPVPYRSTEKSGKAPEDISVESTIGGKDRSKAAKSDTKSSPSNSLAALRHNALDTFLQFLLDSLGDGKNQLAGGKGDDRLHSPGDGSIIDGGDGDDDIATYDHSYAQGGAGKDSRENRERLIYDNRNADAGDATPATHDMQSMPGMDMGNGSSGGSAAPASQPSN